MLSILTNIDNIVFSTLVLSVVLPSIYRADKNKPTLTVYIVISPIILLLLSATYVSFFNMDSIWQFLHLDVLHFNCLQIIKEFLVCVMWIISTVAFALVTQVCWWILCRKTSITWLQYDKRKNNQYVLSLFLFLMHVMLLMFIYQEYKPSSTLQLLDILNLIMMSYGALLIGALFCPIKKGVITK